MATSNFYAPFFTSVLNKEVDIDSDTFKVMLCTAAYVPDLNTHRYKSQVTNEVAGTGYTAGGVTISPLAVNYSASTKTLSFSGANAAWQTATLTARYAVLYDASPASDAARPLIGIVDFGGDVSSTAQSFTVIWDPAGIGTVTVT